VGAVPLGNFTPVNVPVRPPVESCTMIRTKPLPAVAVGIAKVQLPFIVTVWTVPLVSDKVCDVLLLPIATTPSVKELAVIPIVPSNVIAIFYSVYVIAKVCKLPVYPNVYLVPLIVMTILPADPEPALHAPPVPAELAQSASVLPPGVVPLPLL